MRLDRLDLARYGKFTDRVIDFGRPTPGPPDLHIVYGPNEAGKSTLLSAYLDLLFGIERMSGYGFLHPYPVMRVGATVTIGGVEHRLARLKRQQGSLVAPDDWSLPDTLFSGVLGGMDRQTYQMMFSLDDDSIERGGEAILKSEGELGSLLFSASSGLSGVSAGLAELALSADRFYRPQARKHDLAALKAELDRLREARKESDVAAREYGALVRSRDAAAARYDEALAARTGTRLAMEDVERRAAALPLLRRLRDLRAQLAAFEPGEAPPGDWAPLVARLAREAAEIAGRADRVARDRARLVAALEAVDEDPDILALEVRVDMLDGSDLEARYRTAEMDLPARIREREAVEGEVAARLALLKLPPGGDPAAYALPEGVGEALSRLHAAHSGLVERLRTATAEARQAERQQVEAKEALDKAAAPAAEPTTGQAEADVAKGQILLRSIKGGGLVARLREAERRAADERQAVGTLVAGLRPWQGEPESLRAVDIPSAIAGDDLSRRRRAAVDASRDAEDRLAAMRDALAVKTATLDALRAATRMETDAEAADIRNAREAAWRDHRKALDTASADRFEAAMERDDQAGERRLAQADRLSEMRLTERAIAEETARVASLSAEASRLSSGLAGIDASVAAHTGRLALPASTAVETLAVWLRQRERVVEALDLLARAEAERALVLREAEQAAAQLAESLGFATTKTVDAPALEQVVLAAEDRLAALGADAARHQQAEAALQRASGTLAERQAALRDAEQAIADWQAGWKRQLAGTWLGAETYLELTDPERLGPLLPALSSLSRQIESGRDLDHRIAAMQRDQADYRRHVEELGARLGHDRAGTDAGELLKALAMRLEKARAARAERARLALAFEALEAEERDLAERRIVVERQMQPVHDHLGTETYAEAEAALESHARRAALVERVDETARDLARQVMVATVEEAEAMLAAVDEPELAAERSRLAALYEAQDAEVRECHTARLRITEQLDRIGGDDTAARLEEERRTVLVDLVEKSRRHLAARAGIMAAEAALRLYRERHRSAMMRRASDAFRTISGGEYSGLSTVIEKDQEILVADAAAGGSKLARELSKGTRFQLYLALRVAGYHEIAASREILPFIADDIMETFDDGRAFNTFRLMAEMAVVGQVIYLTHHQHLRDLAREACPQAVVHDL